LGDVSEDRQHLVELDEVVPGSLLDPVGIRLRQSNRLVCDTNCASEEEEVLVRLDITLHHLHLHSELEGEEQLVALEQAAARISVHVQDVALVDRQNLVLVGRILLCVTDRLLEDVSIPVKRELIHGVDLVEVEEDKEEGCRESTARPELVSRLVNLFHGVA
jgi:hypothetical protein